MKPFYITTPIYYVNDRPHIGHVYTTTVADVLARYHRLTGRRVFFLTGVDEHATKVQESALRQGVSPQEWADRNAALFEAVFHQLSFTNDDFIRTTQERHRTRVRGYVEQLIQSGDVYAGEYEGWYDAGQEEYIPENKAKELEYRSPINGKPLVRKKERNYFFALSRYEERLRRHMEEHPGFIQPEARRNEVLGRLREGLNDVPISRTGAGGWGIPLPGDEEHTIYVWIDALFNYRTAVDEGDRRDFWPADIHLLAKDILWFHAVIWPALLMGLRWELPEQIYAHSFWISEGQKMSKSLGNFIDLEQIERYVQQFGLDALRYFLATQGPMGVTDSDFAHQKFVEVYNSDLANDLGNTASRILNMTQRYFEGVVPACDPSASEPTEGRLVETAESAVVDLRAAFERLDVAGAMQAAWRLHDAASAYIVAHEPWKLAKQEDRRPRLRVVMYHLLEVLRLLSVMTAPVLPRAASELHDRLGLGGLEAKGTPDLLRWGGLPEGIRTRVGDPLFPRHAEPSA